MSIHSMEGGVSFNEGRDPRLERLADANKKVAEAREKIQEDLKALEESESERRIAYGELIGSVIPTEGSILLHRDKSTGRPFKVLGAETHGSHQLYSQQVEISEVTHQGVWVKAEDGHEVLLDIDSIHHPQAAPPEIDI